MRLNCVTAEYAPLWTDCYSDAFKRDSWTADDLGRTAILADVGASWSPRTPLRRAVDRRRAGIELDALVAIALQVSADELCSVYRTQFPVLAGYDRTQYAFDANGRLVPSTILASSQHAKKLLTLEERYVTHPGSQVTYVYDPPFLFLDREADLRAAYEEFERRLATSSLNAS